MIRRGLDEPIEKDCVGTCRLAYDDVVETELHAALFFDGGRLLKKEVVEGADRLHGKASHVEPEADVARDDRDVGRRRRVDDAAGEDQILAVMEPGLPVPVHHVKQVRQGRDGVVPEFMIDCARMRGLALDAATLVPQIPANAGNHRRTVDGLLVKPRSLLDVKLDKGRNLREIHERLSRRDALDVDPALKKNVLQKSPRIPAREFELKGLELARQRQTARIGTSEFRALLHAECNDTEVPFGYPIRILQIFGHGERRDDAGKPIVIAALRNGVGVRSRDEGWQIPVATWQSHPEVERSISMDFKTDLARGLGESLVHLVFFGRIPLARDAAGVGGELADVFKETSAEVFNVVGEFGHEAVPLPVGFGWSEWSRDRLDWIDCSSVPLDGPELMKGSAEREAMR